MTNWLDLDPKITAIITGISLVFLYLFYFFGKMYEFNDEDKMKKRLPPTTREDYIITGFHFCSLYVVFPLAIFLFCLFCLFCLSSEILGFIATILILFFIDILIFLIVFVSVIKNKKRYIVWGILCQKNILIKLIISVLLILLVFYILYVLYIDLFWILFQIFCVFFLEQIAQETDLASYFMRKVFRSKCIKECCIITEKHYFFKYLLIPLVSLFEYPSFIFACRLYSVQDPISVQDPNLISFFVSIIVVFMGLAFLAISLGKLHAYVLPFERPTKF